MRSAMRRKIGGEIGGEIGGKIGGKIGVLVMFVACASEPAPASKTETATPAAPAPAAPAWEKDGAVFTGPPAGGRGGAYSYTLCPGGSYVRRCLDADCDRGSWRREGETVVLLSTNPDTNGQETRLALSADGKTLGPPDVEGGPLTLSGPPEPAACGG